jgi:hypothetical protein
MGSWSMRVGVIFVGIVGIASVSDRAVARREGGHRCSDVSTILVSGWIKEAS